VNSSERLVAELTEEYRRYAPVSNDLNTRAGRSLVDGGSHALRLMDPFPPRIVAAQGARITDEDGHSILDFWQGHHANLLGHNPAVITTELAGAFGEQFGLQTGFADRLQIEAAELLCRQTGAERVRFTTSGSLATMYTILLSKAYTKRDLVIKVGGGWHGAQPWGLKGVDYHAQNGSFQHVDSAGLPPSITDEVLVVLFNQTELLEEMFRRHGERVACFIVEPFIGAGGFMPATLEFMQAARKLTEKYGSLLILDEVISGFRFRAGNAGALYGVEADLATYGKVMGGGMPVSAVAGKAEIMNLAGKSASVRFSGGTFSAHPASLLAAKVCMQYLIDHEAEIYPRLGKLGEQARRTVEKAFIEEGVYACCTGYGNEVLKESSLAMLLFPREEGYRITSVADTRDPEVVDILLTNLGLQLALLLEDIHVFNGLGSISTAHTEQDIAHLGEACRKVARRIRGKS
jgi:glutamate-1-semialdehyde 2,1-aminomutase